MIVLSERQIEIIILMLLKDDYFIADDLKNVMHVSNRTIRNDLLQIKLFLKDYDVQMKSEPHKGYNILAGADKKQLILNHLSNVKPTSNEEYIKAIGVLLLSLNSTTYNEISEILGLSKQTIIKFVNSVKDLFLTYNLTIEKTKGKGIKVKGDEKEIRRAMFHLVNDEKENNFIFNMSEKIFLKDTYLAFAKEIINGIEKKAKVIFYNQRNVEFLLSYILYRVANGNAINDKSIKKKIKNNKDYKIYYKSLNKIELDENEKDYIVYLLIGEKIKRLNNKTDNEGDANKLAKFLTRKLELLHPFKKEKQEVFINDLTMHLKVAFYRIRNNIPIKNELLEQIKISIPLLYLYTKQQLLSQEKKYNVVFDENEIAYIAIYLASVFETTIKIDKKVKILIVCSFGVATSTLLNSRLSELSTESEIIGTMSYKEAEKYINKNNVDIIISTHQIDDINLPVIVVSPLIRVEEMNYIRNKISQISYEKMCQSFMSSYLKNTKKSKNKIYISDYINENAIKIREKCNNWEEAIEIAAEPLLKENKIELRYIASMINAINKFGNYMVLLPDTAFVHAGTESGIYEDCCSMLVLKKPIVFGSVNKKNVRNIIVLGVKNRDKLTLIDLVAILQNRNNMEELKKDNINVNTILSLHN